MSTQKKLTDTELQEAIDATEGGKSFSSMTSNALAKEVKELRVKVKDLENGSI